MKIIKNKSLKTFFEYSLKHKWLMLGVIILSTVTSLAAALPAWLSKYLIDDVFIAKNRKMMVLIIGAIGITTIIKVVSGYYANITSSYVTETIKKDIRVDVFKHLQYLPLSYFKKNKLGDLMSRLSGDTSILGQIGFIMFDMGKEGIAVLALTFRMFQVDYVLALISLVVLPLIISTVRKYTKKIRESGRVRQDTMGEVVAFIQESLSGISIIKAFNRSEVMIHKYKQLSQDEFEKSYRSRKISAKVSPINEVIATFMILLVALYGAYNIVTSKMSAGDLVSFLTAVGLMQQPLKRLIQKNNSLQEALPSADRVIEIMELALEQEYHGEVKTFSGKAETIEFKNVSFKYENKKEKALDDINLKVKRGEVIALIGQSGSGKTTMVNLIPRFYEIEEGTILVNNIDIRNYALKEYRNYIGIVPQETILFSGTVAENLRFGKENVTDEQVIEAAKMANAYDFIMEMEKGFDTEVGERGTLISGGQKQRLAIARALIQDPEIMILDEATSALDSESEKLVQEALEKLMKNRTTFVIAHRLSTIVDADKIVVMKQGKILEVGTHEELIKKDGAYKGLYTIQFGDKNNLKEKE